MFGHIAAALVPLAALAFLLSYSDHLRRADEEHARFIDYARLIGQSSAKVMARAEGYAGALAALPSTSLGDCEDLFASMREELIEAVELDIARGGERLCRVVLSEGKITPLPPGSARVPASAAIAVSRINEATGVRIGIGLRPQTLLTAPIAATISSNIGFALVDEVGTVLASHTYDTNYQRAFLDAVGSLTPVNWPAGSFTENDNGWYIGSAALPGTQYRVVTASQPTATLLEPWLSITSALAPPLLLLAIVFVVLRYGIQRFLLRYLNHIYATFRRYGAGDTRARVGELVAAPPEISLLGITFDMMADRIDHRARDLEAALGEQQRLSRELHHRIKNTLQMITSLVAMQRRDAMQDNEKAVLRVALERVLSISAAYRVSYASNEGTDVAIEALVRDVVESLRGPAMVSQGKVRILFSGTSRSSIDLDRAIPLAFILAELLPQRFDGLQHGERLNIEIEGGETISLLISGASGIEEVLDDVEEEAPLRARLVRAYLRQLSASCTLEGNTTRLEIPAARQPETPDRAGNSSI
ncbi:sensor histidine kinase [Stappia sp.]|uniref:sensor histidine kinase n=1 Tax=Stappia sp. TaxID=1870903 RepID=UPI003D0D6509